MKSFCLLILFLNPPSFSFSCHGYATRGCNEASRKKEKGDAVKKLKNSSD